MKKGTLPRTEDLETFAAIAQEDGLNGAARHLGLPKSTVSRRLGRLEQEMKVRLFSRNHHKLTLTDAGQRLLQLCGEALEGLQTFSLAASEMQSLPRGTLRISAAMDLSMHGDVWLGFVERFPEVSLELEFSNRYVDVVREGFDLALRGGRGEDQTLISRRLGSYPLIAVASPAYRDRYGALEKPADLRSHSCLLLAGFRRKHSQRPKAPHRHLVINNAHMALEGALRGMGVAILPEELVEDALSQGRLVSMLEDYNPLDVPLYAVFPERAYMRPVVAACLDYLTGMFRDGSLDPPGA